VKNGIWNLILSNPCKRIGDTFGKRLGILWLEGRGVNRMDIKNLVKNVSIYGILPVIGKFVGFFLVPIYVRIFTQDEYASIDLTISLISFLLYGCELSMQAAVGRHFYTRKIFREKQVLMSTGLLIVLASTLSIAVSMLIFKKQIIAFYFKNVLSDTIYYSAVIWMILASIYSYLCLIPRYENQPQKYVLSFTYSLFLRAGSTLIFVLVFKWGIISVIIGHILGSFLSSIQMIWFSRNYIRMRFDKNEAVMLLKFAIPLLPGVLLITFWQPLMRNMISNYYSLSVVALLSFSISLTSILAIIRSAIDLAFKPVLFENYSSISFKSDIYKVSQIVVLFMFFAALFLICLSPELCLIIGREAYRDSNVLVGFVALFNIFNIITQLRGFGPYILKNTFIISITEAISIFIAIVIFYFMRDNFGLIGIGLVFMLPSLIKYIYVVRYTEKKMNYRLYSRKECWLLMLLIIAIILIVLDMQLVWRISFMFSVYAFFLYKSKKGEMLFALLKRKNYE
jgi:O-antigen/teichoic acid export membrane protein